MGILWSMVWYGMEWFVEDGLRQTSDHVVSQQRNCTQKEKLHSSALIELPQDRKLYRNHIRNTKSLIHFYFITLIMQEPDNNVFSLCVADWAYALAKGSE